MTGDRASERTIPDDDAPASAFESTAIVGSGAEPSKVSQAPAATHASEHGDVETITEKILEDVTQNPGTKEEVDVPVSQFPMGLEDQLGQGSGSESGSQSEPDYWKRSNPHNWKSRVDDEVDWSSKLDTTRLYQAYVNRLRHQDAKSNRKKGRLRERDEEEDEEEDETEDEEEDGKTDRKGDAATETPDKAPVMIRGVVDYVRVLEERIQRLENSQDKPGGKEGQKEADDTNAKGENESGELVMEAKFFHADGEFDALGNWKDNILKKGSYQCVSDPKYLIRVLYKWSSDVQHKRLEGAEKPDARDVEILAFGVASTPIATFFQQTLGFGMHKSDIVRFVKPFRPLIRSSGSLRAQLGKLESRFGTDSGPNNIEQGDSALAQDDALPVVSSSPEDLDNQTDFDTPDALAHFRCLFQFLDEYLARPISLYQRLQAGVEDKIAFEDTWMLFDNGKKIYCPSYSGGSVRLRGVDDVHLSKPRYVPQLFQVLGTAGGIPKRSTRASLQTRHEEDVSTSSLSEYFYMRSHASGSEQDPGSQKTTIPSKWRSKNRFPSLYVICFHVDFDGVRYGTVREILEFKPHDGLVDIRSLTAFPIQYLRPEPRQDRADSDDIRRETMRFVERGKKFIDVTALAHKSYEGLTVGQSREEINSAVIIDFDLSFREYQSSFPDSQNVVPHMGTLPGFWPTTQINEVEEFPSSTCGKDWCHKFVCTADTHYGFQRLRIEKIEERIKGLLDDYEPSIALRERGLQDFKQFMEEHDLIDLLPGVVPGFVLRSRKWVQLDLDLLSEVQQGDDWEKLVLPTGHREMVQAMVVTHSRGSQQSKLKDLSRQKKADMDLVQGKGRGCIILLHGVPGVGKTSTAECVAAYTRRPLYPITCGDIGYLPAEVEKNMEEHFKLAHRWGCVLLLDEADVFLAKRNKADVKRNGLVSVFLRILEYYPGILFLTTNRVGAIDDAFRSRLHLTLYYPKLTGEQTRKIWKNNLSRLRAINREREERGQETIHFDKKELLEWLKLNWELLQWNGRQIRNAFQTAIALAEFHATNDDAAIPSIHSRSDSKKGKPKGPLLDVSHFKLIANATLQFNEYLFATHGFDEDELAKRDKMRLSSHQTTLKLKDVAKAESSSSDESESEIGTAGSSSDESAKEAARKKAKRKDKKKKSKGKKKSKKVQSDASGSDSDTGAKEKKPKTKKKAEQVQSEGSSDESDKGATSQKA